MMYLNIMVYNSYLCFGKRTEILKGCKLRRHEFWIKANEFFQGMILTDFYRIEEIKKVR